MSPSNQSNADTEEVARAHLRVTRERLARRSGVRDMIFGAQDGLLTTLGLVAGVSGAAVARSALLVAALAGATDGMLALGGSTSRQVPKEVFLAEIDNERREVARAQERGLRSWCTSSSRTGSRGKMPERWLRQSLGTRGRG